MGEENKKIKFCSAEKTNMDKENPQDEAQKSRLRTGTETFTPNAFNPPQPFYNNFQNQMWDPSMMYQYNQQYNPMFNFNMFNNFMQPQDMFFGMGGNDQYVFCNEFPRLNYYHNIDQIRNSFPGMARINIDYFDPTKIPAGSKFFMIRSSTHDDIHKSMKYGVWTSTPKTNIKLNEAFEEVTKTDTKGKVFLFFRTVSMNTLNGVAVLDTPLNSEESFPLWWNKHKWKGMFNVRWIYVKNVDLTPLNMREGPKKIYELHDGTELCEENGMSLVRIFKSYDTTNNIFSLFPILDMREDKLMDYRKNLGFEIKLTKIRKESANPDYSFPAKRAGEQRASIAEPPVEGYNEKKYKTSWVCSESDSDDYEPKDKKASRRLSSKNWGPGDHKGSYNRNQSGAGGYELKKDNVDTAGQNQAQAEGNTTGAGLNNNTGMYYQLQKNVRGAPQNQNGEAWQNDRNSGDFSERRDDGKRGGKPFNRDQYKGKSDRSSSRRGKRSESGNYVKKEGANVDDEYVLKKE